MSLSPSSRRATVALFASILLDTTSAVTCLLIHTFDAQNFLKSEYGEKEHAPSGSGLPRLTNSVPVMNASLGHYLGQNL